MKEIIYQPIATFKSSHQHTYAAPRQGILSSDSFGVVHLNENFDDSSCEDLIGFDKVWLIYDFHENNTWKSKVRPPRFSETKKSVFSTRSPYRPNSIGISCVTLDKVEGTRLYVSDHDLLDGTPILDIKPYLPYADSFVDVKTGWVKNINPYEIRFSESTEEKILWLENETEINFKDILKNQLAYEPTNSKAKRVKKMNGMYIFSIRTWRFEFTVIDQVIEVKSVYGGYSEKEINAADDPYGDKETHRSFLLKYP